MSKIKCAIIGSGNIGTDLMIKILKGSDSLELAVVVGIDEKSEGLAMARERGVATTHDGIEGLKKMGSYPEIGVVFDATSAYAHKVHDEILRADGKQIVDLTPAALGPFTVPLMRTVESALMVSMGLPSVSVIAVTAAEFRAMARRIDGSPSKAKIRWLVPMTLVGVAATLVRR